MSRELRNTGERVIPEDYQASPASRLIYLSHLATYRFCAPYVENRRVLDFGCGTGHGTAEMAATCAAAVGVDVSPQAIEYARSRYPSSNVRYRVIPRIEVEPLPFEDHSFDAVVSIQVIEHIRDPLAYLAEARRVLRHPGTIVIATPDRTSRLFPFQKPWNPFHVVEYAADGLRELVATEFDAVEILNMSGALHAIAPELRRTRNMKWATLPFTLPATPEGVRFRALGALKAAARLAGRLRNARPSAPPSVTEDDLHIGRDLSPSVNLIAVGKV
jgi:SAM-dependent methyltransferase